MKRRKLLTKRQKRAIIGLALSLIIAGLGALSEHQDSGVRGTLGSVSPGSYRVVSAEDGDTITVDMDGQQERVRFIGVDTPETQDPRKPVQCFGRAASEFTKNLIGDNPVRLESDPLSSNRDRYNRLLRYIYLPDGRLVQREIIREGYGFAYTSFPFSKSDEFKALEDEARRAGRGLWGACETGFDNRGFRTINPE